ncbi:MFS transporter [Actinomadura kijaniata]|uniref:MFS transporter n=1 Tax=Actinomadura kijaniata TaxID=46161 RepID=UPI00082D7578|nr:MFS transporter [Actinomadura kijaniata]
MTATASPDARSDAPRRARHARAALVLSSAATLLSVMNYTAPIATLSLTSAELRAGPTAQIWIMSSVSLGMAAVMLAVGGLADDHGRRRVFGLGAALMAAASVVCAVAPNATVFVAGRLVQGVAGAALQVTGLGMLAVAFPAGPGRVRATGLWGSMLGLAIALGPIAAAGIAVVDWRGWYWVCAVVAVPLGLAGRWLLPESRAAVRRGADPVGLVTLTGGVAALLAAVTLGRDGWGRPPVLALLASAALLLAAFAVAEARHRAPLLDLRLLAHRPLLLSVTGALVYGFAIIGIMSYLATALDVAMGMTPLVAALVLAVWSGTSWLAALQARRLPARLSAGHLLAGALLLSAAGELALLGLAPDVHWWRLVPGLLVCGIGSGLGNAMLARAAVDSVPPERASMGSGANNTARYIGAALGVTAVVAIVTTTGGGGRPTAEALTHGTNVALAVSAALALLGAVLAVLLHRPVRRASR